jgi:hypothetical protein
MRRTFIIASLLTTLCAHTNATADTTNPAPASHRCVVQEPPTCFGKVAGTVPPGLRLIPVSANRFVDPARLQRNAAAMQTHGFVTVSDADLALETLESYASLERIVFPGAADAAALAAPRQLPPQFATAVKRRLGESRYVGSRLDDPITTSHKFRLSAGSALRFLEIDFRAQQPQIEFPREMINALVAGYPAIMVATATKADGKSVTLLQWTNGRTLFTLDLLETSRDAGNQEKLLAAAADIQALVDEETRPLSVR